MTEPAYTLEETAPDEAWDRFVQISPVGTLFSLSTLLNATGSPFRLFRVLRKQEWRAAVVVNEDADGQSRLDDFVIHNGLLFAPPAKQQNQAQMLSERFDIATAVAAALPQRYSRVALALSPQLVDIRPFLWYRYGEPGPHYTASVRYTAYLGLEDFAQAGGDAAVAGDPAVNAHFAELAYARRQEVRKAIKAGLVTREDANGADLAAFYTLTMQRQGIVVSAEKEADLRRFTDTLCAAGLARLFVCRTADGTPGAMALFGWDAKRAYYLFGAGDPALRDTPCGTCVIWDALRALAAAGLREVDLEGVNSPRRGWFKLSFGARLLPYYQLVLS